MAARSACPISLSRARFRTHGDWRAVMDGEGGDQRRILVIEDDPAARFNMVSYLEDCGFAVSEEDDGARAIEMSRTSPPDLVLCDLRMPGMDGLDVVQALHAQAPDLPLVVVSGTGVLGDAVEALRKGAWDFIPKPIQNMAVLEHAINGAIEKARLVRDTRRFQAELERANRKLRKNLEQFELDAAAGRKTQLQLMPPPEGRIGAYRFNRHLQPSLYLSGDSVDYFALDQGHVGFFLADVSGHGASSAFVTVLLKSFVHRYRDLLANEGEQTALEPTRMLARLNIDLLAQNLDKYLTIFYGVIEIDTNRLAYANGGHQPNPVLLDEAGARFLDGRGPPLGLFREAEFPDHHVDLPTSHLLVLCSDGVLDALPEPTLAKRRARLLRAVDRPGLAAGDVLASLGLAADTAYPDDVTLLIAEREP
jgi:sigma-B regulation protein RsbU (phosphoserine phosphatase)